MQERCHKGRTFTCTHLFNTQLTVAKDRIDVRCKVHDPIANDLLQLFLRYAKCWLHFIQRTQKVLPIHTHAFDVVGDTGHRTDLDVAVKGKRRRTLHETGNFCTRKVLCKCSEFLQIHVAVHDSIRAHLGSLDVDDL